VNGGAEYRAIARKVEEFGAYWCRHSGDLVAQQITNQLRADTGGDGRLSNARLGPADVRVKATAKAAYIKNSGSKVVWAWLEEGTGTHTISPKGRGRGRRRALRTPYGPRARVTVSGMKPKQTWTKGNERGMAAAERDATYQFGRMLGG